MAKPARFLYAVVILALPYLLLTSAAQAVPPADEAAAEVLFNQATEAALARHLDVACAKFAEAQRLDPTAGTLLSLGKCETERGNLATAYGAYVAAISLAQQDNDKKGREGRARDAASKLLPQLSMLVITVAPGTRADGMEIKRNGKVVGEGQWGSPVPMDPGTVTIEATAPGRLAWKTTIRIEPKPGSTTIAVPALAPAVETAAPGIPPAPVRAEKEEESHWSGQAIGGVVVGGAGVLGIALGTIFGVKAIGKKSDADARCRPEDPSRCDATGVTLRQDEKTAGTISTVALIAGGVSLAGGVVLLVTAPRKQAKPAAGFRLEASPTMAGGKMGLTLRGSF
jgi:hypothetical protein